MTRSDVHVAKYSQSQCDDSTMNKFLAAIILGSLLTQACSSTTPQSHRTLVPHGHDTIISPYRPSVHHPDAIAGVFAVHNDITGLTLFRSDEFVARTRNTGNLEDRWRLFSDRSLAITLLFVTETVGSWQYKDCHNVSVLADGRQVPVPVSTWDGVLGEPSDEYVYVVLTSGVGPDSPANSARIIARANRVQISYCNEIFEFPLEGRQAIGEMLRRLHVEAQ